MSDIELVFSPEVIARRMSELGEEIRRDAGDGEVFLLGLLKGTSCFLADLLRSVPPPVTYGFVDVISDIADTATASALQIDYLSFTNITEKNVYVLKDVVSTGIIETYLLSQFRIRRPASLKLVALLDRPELRTTELAADFRAFEVNAGSYVGYGLELHGKHGNLPYIGRVRD